MHTVNMCEQYFSLQNVKYNLITFKMYLILLNLILKEAYEITLMSVYPILSLFLLNVFRRLLRSPCCVSAK